MAYYKLNSLRLYVEHVFAFEETKGLRGATGFLTKEEIREIGAYCRENFVVFIPSLSTFGHMYELLEQAQYRHLRVLKNFVASPNFWRERMSHHTIDPFDPESIAFVQNLINQYAPHFDSDTFNICCDETFDLKQYQTQGLDVGAIYRVTDTRDWLNRYRTNWLQKNKVSEFRNIEDMFCYYDGLNRIEK